jgi:predicted nuclease of predicted toxin-antitoxin system
MPESIKKILLDQNIPQALLGWLKERLPGWEIQHVNELGFQGQSDEFLFLWALENKAIIVTYDEDFADSRFYPLGRHYGIIRLRVWPTTIEQTQNAMERLLSDCPSSNWNNCLIIIDNQKIRIRKLKVATDLAEV